ncbi:hypothetical protein BESB_072060 [Besnoitia besnoiti]|uniref:RRM domain-containing protein n=1 Tax=Besnoitia besnoiti TaxID=94643 RepID=A0A2A9MA32_BESBE|nr:uncharacterized protein BESB_072060 [Besnoitia besnoiti]PFH34054.1 hypothetical protein BESB_072060 [Besnoitia besnoiti]
MLGRRRKGGLERSAAPAKETKKWRLELNEENACASPRLSSQPRTSLSISSSSSVDSHIYYVDSASERSRSSSSSRPSGVRTPGDRREGEEDALAPELTEEELRLLQADDDDEGEREREREDRKAEADKQQADDSAQGNGEEVARPKKRRRFAWMESDDESITASSSDSEEDEEPSALPPAAEEPKTPSPSSACPTPLPPGAPRNSLFTVSPPSLSSSSSPPSLGAASPPPNSSSPVSPEASTAPPEPERDVVSASVFVSDLAALGLQFAGGDREELCEGMQRCITTLYLMNLSFEASLGEIETWVESHLQVRPLDVFPSPSATAPDAAPPGAKAPFAAPRSPFGAAPPGDRSPSDSQHHRGRVFVELGSYTKVRLGVQKLNGLYLRGRPVRALFAFTVKGRPCTLQTAMHLKFLRQHVLQEVMGVEGAPRFQRKKPGWNIDGGCNWVGT